MSSVALHGAQGDETGPVGPVAFSALLVLIAISPLMRGGNRHVALIVLEALALVFLAFICFRPVPVVPRVSLRGALLAVLLLSPLWLALVYLLPVPEALWAAMPGRGFYASLLSGAGVPAGGWRPLSLVPDGTTTSLLTGIPLMAAFVAGLALRLPQLTVALKVLVGVAFLEVVIGLLQAGGGRDTTLYFGIDSTRPFGTFANPNHYGNYLAMALAAYVWLAWMRLTQARRIEPTRPGGQRRTIALLIAGAMLLLVGLLMSRSRGAALGGIPAAVLALAFALTVGTGRRGWKITLLVAGGALLATLALVGFDTIISRFDVRSFATDASLRNLIASSTLQGAAAFWPLGSGWGTYAEVYPRFQPVQSGLSMHMVPHAHQDYVEMLFEGGIFAVVLMAAFAWLAITRIIYLVRTATRHRRLRREEMAAAICGIGLLGFLLHSLVEFNMHIPANAIIASLFAGIFLRPLKPKEEEVPGD